MADSGLALEEEPEPVHIEEEKELSEEKSEFSVASEEESESKEESEGSEISEEEQEEQKDLANEIECQRQKVERMKEALKLAEEKLQQLQIDELGERGIIANADQVLSNESFRGVISSEMEVMGRRHLEKMTKKQLFQLLNHHDDKASQKIKKEDLVKYILSKGYHESYAMPLAQFFSKENSDKGIFEGIFFEKSIKKKKANDSGDEDSSSS